MVRVADQAAVGGRGLASWELKHCPLLQPVRVYVPKAGQVLQPRRGVGSESLGKGAANEHLLPSSWVKVHCLRQPRGSHTAWASGSLPYWCR